MLMLNNTQQIVNSSMKLSPDGVVIKSKKSSNKEFYTNSNSVLS